MFKPLLRFRFERRHQHPWKLMALGSVVGGMLIVVSLMEGWYWLAVVGLIFLLTMAVQWITIDPPYVDEDDLHGGPEPETKAKSG